MSKNKSQAPSFSPVSYAKQLRSGAINAIGSRLAPAGRDRHKASTGNLGRMTKYFEGLGVRAACIHAGKVGEDLKAWTGAVIEQIHTDGWLKERNEVMVCAARGDSAAQAELAEIVRRTVTNLLMAHANWAAFFDMQSLANDETAYLEFETPREITFDTIGEDGGLITAQADLEKSQALCKLFYLWSEEFEYPLVDVYKGDVASLALATIDAARDLAQKINGLLGSYILVGGASSRIGAFTLDGSPTAHYVAHSGIHTSNLPTTNLPTITGNSTTSLFRKEVFDAFIEYVESWGTGAFGDGGDLRVAGIHVASKNSADFLKQLSLTTESNFATQQIFEGGRLVSYGGYTFPIIFDNTIPATGAGYAYLRTNKPIGQMFEKPGLDQVDAGQDKRSNKGHYSQGKVVGFGMANAWSVNCAAVKFRDA
jgi:hypothetical protein